MQVSFCTEAIHPRHRFSRQVEVDPQSVVVTGHSSHQITGKNGHHFESLQISWLLSVFLPGCAGLFWPRKPLPSPDS